VEIAIFVFIFVHLFLGFCFGSPIRRSLSLPLFLSHKTNAQKHAHTFTETARSLAIALSLAPARSVYTYICLYVCMYGFYDDEKCLLLLHKNQVFCSRFSHFFGNCPLQIRCNSTGSHCPAHSHTLFTTVHQLFSTFSAFFDERKRPSCDFSSIFSV